MTAEAFPNALKAAVAERAAEALRRNPARVQRIEVQGARYWVKRVESLTLRMRLQKGDPRRAFAAERRAIADLARAGAPVAPVVAEGPDWFATPDAGPTLRALLRDPAVPAQERLRAFAAAATALAGLHARGLSHGRPAIWDICWDGERIAFLDLERAAPRRNRPRGHVQDLVILMFSAFAETGRPCPETEALARAYRAADPGGIWDGARRLCRRLRWIDPLSRPIQRLERAREFRAIPLTLRAFGAV